ncbi:MAG: GGDEF domain-containing protein [Mycobacterium sp.]
MGRSEFAFATQALREGSLTKTFTRFVGASSFAMAGMGVVAQFLPHGPDNPTTRLLLAVAAIVATVVGARWLLTPWPRYGAAVAFVIWADCALALGASTMSTPQAQLCSTLYMGLVGGFAAFLLSPRILYLHCAVGFLVIAAITGWATASGRSDPIELFVFYMPALTWVVFVPLGGLVMVVRGRRAIGWTARSAAYDPLTGLRNRRGMTAAVDSALREQTGPTTMFVAVCDVDRFKDLNDRQGHAAGDTALEQMAGKLRDIARRGEVVARIGGDELVLVGFLDDAGDMAELPDRLAPLTRGDVDGIELSSSVGVAALATDASHFLVDDVVRHADAAMYQAKRAGGGRCAVYSDPAGA